MLAGSECFTFSQVMTRILARVFFPSAAGVAAFALLEPVYGIREAFTRARVRSRSARFLLRWVPAGILEYMLSSAKPSAR